MELIRVEQQQWLSNAYLAVDDAGETAVLIDGNGVIEPLLERVDSGGLELAQVLLTHAHHDHVVGIAELTRERGTPVAATAATAAELDFEVERVLEDGARIGFGGIEVEAIETPGHAAGHMAFVLNGADCMTGDSIFKGTVAGTMAPGATGIDDLRESIMERLLKLPPETVLHPGHREPTTVAAEWEQNPFVRVWRGLDPEGSDSCTVFGQRPATLVLWAPDYDGTNKAWVRFEDGQEAIVGGSQITR